MAAAPEPLPPEGSAPLDHIPAVQIGDSLLAVLGRDPESRKMAMAGLLALFATFTGLVVYGAGKAKMPKGD
jgi:hypothetical protein